MSSSSRWELVVTKPAEKRLGTFPPKDRARIQAALLEMRENPFAGDIVRLKALPSAWRRRVGSYRILFDISPEHLRIVVTGIERRTSTTY